MDVGGMMEPGRGGGGLAGGLDGAGWCRIGGAMRGGAGKGRRMEDGWVWSWKVGMEGLDGGGGAGWRRLDGGGLDGRVLDGEEGWRGLSGWRDRTAQTEPHKPNCKKNRTETKAKPIPETETNRNEPRLY